MAVVVRVQPSNGGWQVEVDGRTLLFSTQGESTGSALKPVALRPNACGMLDSGRRRV